MAEHVTRCPHCQTSFRVRSEHLAAAKGKVRCGSCLQVFNAKNHLILSKAEQAAAQRAKQASSPTTPAATPTRAALTPDSSIANPDSSPTPSGSADSSTPKSRTSAPAAASALDADGDDDDLSSLMEVSADQLFDGMFDDPAPEPSRATSNIQPQEPEEEESLEELFGLAPKKEKVVEQNSLLSDDPFADFSDIISKGSSGGSSDDIDIDESLLDFRRQNNEPEMESDSDDEDWARALLEDDDDDDFDLNSDPMADTEPEAEPEQQSPATRFSDGSEKSHTGSQESPSTEYSTRISESARRKTSSSMAFQLAADDTDESQEDAPEPEAATVPQSNQNFQGEGILGQSFDLSTPAPGRSSAADIDLAHDIQADPISLTSSDKQKDAANFPVGWLLGSVGLAFLMLLQIGYFGFQSLARDPGYRPLYQSVCAMAGCQLPSLQDTSQMAARNLIVRTHPETPSALAVDALLINHADFNQSFPDLMLIFRDINNETIGARRLTPDEYLAGEMAGADIMPSGIPIHIALELLAPVSPAISHELKLLPNE